MYYLKPIQNQAEYKLNNLLRRFSLEISLNIESIDDDINRLMEIDTRNKNEGFKVNLHNTIDFLENTKKYYLKFMDKTTNKLKISFIPNDEKVRSTPIELKKIELFNLETADYMNIGNGILVDVNYSNLITAMAFRYVYEDLDYTLDEIEDKLEDVNIIITYNEDDFNKLIDDDLNYKVLKTFKIGKCPWIHPNKKEIYSFFNDRIKNTTGKYDKIIEYNARKFMLLIVCNMLEHSSMFKDKISIAGVYEDGFKILVYDEEDLKNVLDFINDGTGIELFGRCFKYIPKIKIIRGNIK